MADITVRAELKLLLEYVDKVDQDSPLEVTEAGLSVLDFMKRRGRSIEATLDAFDRQWRDLQEYKNSAPPRPTQEMETHE